MGVKLHVLYTGFETCFGWDPTTKGCWDLIKKGTSRIQTLRHVDSYFVIERATPVLSSVQFRLA